jgi:endonuclease YncB( thermonuclease family)
VADPNKAIFQKDQLTVGVAHLALQPSGTTASVQLAVHDGDTINVDPRGNLGVRFLGVDAPETTGQLLGETAPGGQPIFRTIDSQQWKNFLTNPFAAAHPEFKPKLPTGLHDYLVSRSGPGCAANHRKHALAAAAELEALVKADQQSQQGGAAAFRFFLAFAHEIIDRYGRFLAYIHHYTPDADPKPLSYNEQLVMKGLVSAYFIWPNIDPFRVPQPSVFRAVPKPGKAIKSPRLDAARQAVKAARAAKVGLFDQADPLALDAFELRYLSRVDGGSRHGPDRRVIDLSAADDRLRKATDYYKIKNAEDRLFVPQEYVPLFVDRGWKLV